MHRFSAGDLPVGNNTADVSPRCQLVAVYGQRCS